jgi:hypothetical protein
MDEAFKGFDENESFAVVTSDDFFLAKGFVQVNQTSSE